MAGDDDSGFNAPFSGLTKSLGKQLRKRARADKETQERSSAVRGKAMPGQPADATPEPGPICDELAFAGAVADVRTLDQRRGRVTPLAGARVAPSTAEQRRREELDQLGDAADFDLSFSDHHVVGRAHDVGRDIVAKLANGQFAVGAHVDLHGMVLEDALSRVDAFLLEEQRRGRRCLLVITGKGRNSPNQKGVLREAVPEWLASGPSARRVLALVTARPCDGGEGALYVLLRKGREPKGRIELVRGGIGKI